MNSINKRSVSNSERNGESIPGGSKKSKRILITKRQKEACFEFFIKHEFSKAAKLPIGKTSDLAIAFNNFLLTEDLKREQVRKQLLSWKNKKYKFHDCIFKKTPHEIQEIIHSHMPVEKSEFITDVIEKMMTTTNVDGKTEWHTQAAESNTYFDKVLPKMVVDPFKDIFVFILDQYVSIATTTFPQKATNCKAADLQFEEMKTKMVEEQFEDFNELMLMHDDELDDLKGIDSKIKCDKIRYRAWKLLYLQIEEKMFYEWSRTSYIDDLPPVKIVLDANISNYSLGILYYSAGCLLKKITNSCKTKNLERQDISNHIFELHSIDGDEAKAMGLPVDVTNVRYIFFKNTMYVINKSIHNILFSPFIIFI